MHPLTRRHKYILICIKRQQAETLKKTLTCTGVLICLSLQTVQTTRANHHRLKQWLRMLKMRLWDFFCCIVKEMGKTQRLRAKKKVCSCGRQPGRCSNVAQPSGSWAARTPQEAPQWDGLGETVFTKTLRVRSVRANKSKPDPLLPVRWKPQWERDAAGGDKWEGWCGSCWNPTLTTSPQRINHAPYRLRSCRGRYHGNISHMQVCMCVIWH